METHAEIVQRWRDLRTMLMQQLEIPWLKPPKNTVNAAANTNDGIDPSQ